jgi:four helix bundle protein
MDIDDLEIYRESMRIGEAVWEEVVRWDYFARDTLGKQLVRCVDSIAANIAEGYGRFHFADNRNFCRYARGSLQESITFLTKAQNRNLIPRETVTCLINDLITLRKRLNAYIRSIGEQGNPQPAP